MDGSTRTRSQRLLLTLAITTAVVLAGAGAASAATFTVTKTADTNDGSCTAANCSLRDAVVAADAAGGSSTITVPAGIYKLTIASTGANDPTTGDLDINNNANVTVNGAGSTSTILDGNNLDRLFAVQQGAALTLSGLTMRTGQPSSNSSGAQSGGAIYTNGGLTIGDAGTGTSGDVAFVTNTSENGGSYDGGALYADSQSTVSLTGATFDNNAADNWGGAIYDSSNNTLTITKSLFRGNQATDEAGGAIYGEGDGGGLSVDSTTFVANESPDGGAIYWDTNTPVSITHSTFNGNQSYDSGGAIYDNDSTTLTANYDSFINNAGPYDGGALYLDATETTAYTLNHDLFSGNISNDDYGGAIYWVLGSLTSTDSTYVNNQASYGDDGGALYADSGGSLTLTNDTITRNNSGDEAGGAIDIDTTTPASLVNDTITSNSSYQGGGGGIYGTGSLTTTGYTGSGAPGIENTVIANNNGGDCDTTFDPSFDLGHNMDSDGSCFGGPVQPTDLPNTEPALGPPANNGGPLVGNQSDGSAVVIPTSGETAASPTVNAGTNTGCPATDERGVTRPQGSACDIGAFELAAAQLRLTKTAPGTVPAKAAFQYTITLSNVGPGYSTGTNVVDQLPSGEKLWGTTPSQGTCTSTGSPAKVTCALGTIAPGSGATVKIVVSRATTGTVTNTAKATNAEGASVSGSAKTKITAVATGTKPKAITGAATGVKASSARLHGRVKPGKQRTSYFFQYRRVGSGAWTVSSLKHTTRTKAVSAGVSGLRSGTTYQYRLVAVNSRGTSYGATRTFRTSGHAVSPRFTG